MHDQSEDNKALEKISQRNSAKMVLNDDEVILKLIFSNFVNPTVTEIKNLICCSM